MSLLFILAVANALAELKQHMHLDEQTCTYCRLQSANGLSTTCWRQVGIPLNAGKTRTRNRAGECPQHMEELGSEVWSLHGVNILGTSVGTAELQEGASQARLEEKHTLWRSISWGPDLQCDDPVATISSVTCHRASPQITLVETMWRCNRH